MQGTIFHFNEAGKKGILRGSNGESYEFSVDEWKVDGQPKAGQVVNFVVKNDQATQIFIVNSSGITIDIFEKISELQGPDIRKRIGALFSSNTSDSFALIKNSLEAFSM